MLADCTARLAGAVCIYAIAHAPKRQDFTGREASLPDMFATSRIGTGRSDAGC